MKKLLLLMICFTFISAAYSAETIGNVKKFSGKVQIFDGTSPRGTDVKTDNTSFALMSKISTKRSSTAVIELNSGDKIALDENSMASFGKNNKINPEGGKIVFSIKKRGGESGVSIGLKTAVIGVKGTQFLVDMTEDGKCNVYLKEGVISVESKEGDFKKHKEVVIDEYEAYVKKMTGEYDKYLEDLQKEYTEFVKSFDMTAGQAISIDGQDVTDVKFDNDAEAAFALLDQ